MKQPEQMEMLVPGRVEKDGTIIDLRDHPAWRNAPRKRQRHAAGPWAPKNVVGLNWWRDGRAKASAGS